MRRSAISIILALIVCLIVITPDTARRADADAPTTTVTALTMSDHGGGSLRQNDSAATTLTMDSAHGWTLQNYSETNDFAVQFAKGQYSYGAKLSTASFRAAAAGTRNVALELDLNSVDCTPESNDAIVRNFATQDGVVTHLDIAFAAECDSETSGWVTGDLQYSSPVTTPAYSTPSEAMFPPTGSQSHTAPMRVTITGASSSSVTVSFFSFTGTRGGVFSLSGSTCGGAVLTRSSSCIVDVSYFPTTSHDRATLTAFDVDGDILSKTVLDGALLPGHYTASVGTAQFAGAGLGRASTYTPGPHNQIFVAMGGLYAGTNAVRVQTGDGESFGFQVDISSPKAFHEGVYHATGASNGNTINIGIRGRGYSHETGTFRIERIGETFVDRGMSVLRPFAMTFDVHTPDLPNPIYGRVVFDAAATPALPGYSKPPAVSGLNHRRTKARTTLGWSASPDVAVVGYVVRARAGKHHSVGFDSGSLMCRVSMSHCATHKFRGHPFTATIYAVDDSGRHSTGRTVAVR